MKRRIFQAELATALIGYQAADEGDENPPHQVNNKRRRAQPDDAVWHDRIDHFPSEQTPAADAVSAIPTSATTWPMSCASCATFVCAVLHNHAQLLCGMSQTANIYVNPS